MKYRLLNTEEFRNGLKVFFDYDDYSCVVIDNIVGELLQKENTWYILNNYVGMNSAIVSNNKYYKYIWRMIDNWNPYYLGYAIKTVKIEDKEENNLEDNYECDKNDIEVNDKECISIFLKEILALIQTQNKILDKQKETIEKCFFFLGKFKKGKEVSLKNASLDKLEEEIKKRYDEKRKKNNNSTCDRINFIELD